MDTIEFREIYNFDHNLPDGFSCQIGPFKITALPDTLNGENIPRNERTIYRKTLDDEGGFKTSIQIEPARIGKWMPTALVEEHPDLDAPSLLFPDSADGAYDLSLILTFLTGLHVSVGNNVAPYLPIQPGQPIVSGYYFIGAHVDWSLLPALRDAGGAESMMALSVAMTNSNALIKLAMGSSALDGIITKWHKKSGNTKYTPEVKKRITEAKKAFERKLIESGEDTELVKDTMARLSNLTSESALSKLRQFLTNFGMFPKDADPSALQRLKWLNTLRNAVAHTGAVPMDLAENAETSTRISTALSILLQFICQVYIAKYLLKINDTSRLHPIQNFILTFFTTGRFNGQDLLTENFEAFTARMTAHWEEYGEYSF